VVYPGHGEPIHDAPTRARELIEHHRIRLDDHAAALSSEPRSAYEVSLAVFGRELTPTQRRFAVAETLSHLERLVREGRAARDGLRITSDPPRFIAAMQLGLTLTSLGIGALGEVALSRLFDKALATVLAVILAYLILTFLHVVIGELVPKGLALGHSEGTALFVSAPVRLFFIVM